MDKILKLLNEAGIEYKIETKQLSNGIANWARTDLIKGKDLGFKIHVELELFEIWPSAKKVAMRQN